MVKTLDKQKIASLAKECICKVREHTGVKLSEIIDISDESVTAEALNKYLKRETTTSYRSQSLDVIISYLQKEKNNLKKSYPGVFDKYLDIILDSSSKDYRNMVKLAYEKIYKILMISKRNIKLLINYTGIYNLYYPVYSADDTLYISRSTLTIRIFDNEHKDIIEYIHEKCSGENTTIDDGVAFVMGNNIYLSGDILNSTAVEMINIEINNNNNNELIGLMLSQCEKSGGRAVASKVILIRRKNPKKCVVQEYEKFSEVEKMIIDMHLKRDAIISI